MALNAGPLEREKAALLTRRDFAVTALGGGYALAVSPASASAIVTPADGLDVAEVQVPVSDGHIPAYRARRKGSSGEAVILIVQEIFGVHEHIKDVCRRFAREGYYAIAPALYAREGDVSQYADIRDIVEKVVAKVPDNQVMADLDASVAFAKGEGAATEKLAVTGFCWGGRITWLYAAHADGLKAGIAWYGRLLAPAEQSPLRPVHPIDVAARLKAPVLGLYGGKDQGIPLAAVDQMTAALEAAGSASKIIVYPEAQHGFFADYRPSYSAADAADAWSKCLEWLRTHGVA